MSEEARHRFEAVYNETYHQLLGYALRRTATPADATELLPNTLILVAGAALRQADPTSPGVHRKRPGQRRSQLTCYKDSGTVRRPGPVPPRGSRR
ncbi:hypothetical protein [Frankia tisae]|uniref:hypothetical protein n=1 Tax=Frankia tisae TaxID=2950104 RepID=UPI0021C0CEEE|nr:hypothetical protein [Frankia tisae]